MSRNGLLYLFGIMTSGLGSNLFLVAIVVWAKQGQDGVGLISYALFSSAIASVLFSPFSGVWIDRLSPKKVMIFTDLINALIMFAIASLLWDSANIFSIYPYVLTLIFLSSLMSTLFSPASLSLVGSISKKKEVKYLTSWASNITQVASILGRGVGGILITMVNPAALILANGFSFLVSAIAELNIRTTNTNKKTYKHFSFFDQFREGIDFLFGNRLLILLFTGSSITNFFLAINAPLMPMIVEDRIGYSISWYGIISGAFGVGAILGGFFARMIAQKKSSFLFSAALVLQGTPYLLIPLSTHPLHLFALIMTVGLLYIFVQVHMLTLVTNSTPPELRGRVFSLMFAIVGLFTPLSYLITGILGDTLKTFIVNLYYLAGIGIPISWLIILFVTRSDKLDLYPSKIQ